MQVTIKYHDNESLTMEEVVRQAQHHYGKNVAVEVMPESTIAYDLIYFGLQQLTTHEQVSLIYDSGSTYQHDLKKFRAEILFKLEEILDQVLIDTEAKAA